MCSRPETSYHRIKSSVGVGAKGPFKVGANEIAGGGGGGQSSMGPGRGSRLGPRSLAAVLALIQAPGPQRGKHCSSKPRRGEWLGPQNPPAVGALLQTRGPQRGKHCSSKPRRGEWLGPRWRWGRCYRRGGHKGVSVIRQDRGGVSGWGHRTRWWWGRCYRRGGHKRASIFHKIM